MEEEEVEEEDQRLSQLGNPVRYPWISLKQVSKASISIRRVRTMKKS